MRSKLLYGKYGEIQRDGFCERIDARIDLAAELAPRERDAFKVAR